MPPPTSQPMFLANSHIQLGAIGVKMETINKAYDGYALNLLKLSRIWIGLPEPDAAVARACKANQLQMKGNLLLYNFHPPVATRSVLTTTAMAVIQFATLFSPLPCARCMVQSGFFFIALHRLIALQKVGN